MRKWESKHAGSSSVEHDKHSHQYQPLCILHIRVLSPPLLEKCPQDKDDMTLLMDQRTLLVCTENPVLQIVFDPETRETGQNCPEMYNGGKNRVIISSNSLSILYSCGTDASSGSAYQILNHSPAVLVLWYPFPLCQWFCQMNTLNDKIPTLLHNTLLMSLH